MAERLASVQNKKVHIIEKRPHIGGNCYDEVDRSAVLVHRYGPHLFHTDNAAVYKYLSRFTQWHEYRHKVVAHVDGKNIAIPFSFTTLYQVFDRPKADLLKRKLIEKYGENKKVSVLALKEAEDEDLQALGEYVYEKIFVHYTAKQWGIPAGEVDPSVLARVPVLTSYDTHYFQDKYQAVPQEGYTRLFEKLLDHPNISLSLGEDAFETVEIREKQLYYRGERFEGTVIFTGMVDELFDHCFGELPYRSLDLKFEVCAQEYYQSNAVVNYPNEHAYTRITEFKHIHPVQSKQTTILKEYPQDYVSGQNTPYYPMPTDDSQEKYQRYAALAQEVDNLILLGRLAEYRYYDMDDIVARALEVFEDLA